MKLKVGLGVLGACVIAIRCAPIERHKCNLYPLPRKTAPAAARIQQQLDVIGVREEHLPVTAQEALATMAATGSALQLAHVTDASLAAAWATLVCQHTQVQGQQARCMCFRSVVLPKFAIAGHCKISPKLREPDTTCYATF
jgi:hypothetical protein